MEQIGYQIVHSIAGRIRIRVAWLETDVDAANKYQRLLEALSYVNSVRINSLAQSIVILYNAKTLTIAEAEALFISVMQQVKLTPPMEVATIETEPTPSPSTPEPVSQPVDETIHETPASTSKSPSTQAASVIPEIPSPWDDEPEEIAAPPGTATDASKSTQLEHTETPSQVESAEVISIDRALSTSLLAQRLRVTSQAITRRRSKADFQTWTQAQDPEGIAWCYNQTSRSFHPVNPSLESPEEIAKTPMKSRSNRKNRK